MRKLTFYIFLILFVSTGCAGIKPLPVYKSGNEERSRTTRTETPRDKRPVLSAPTTNKNTKLISLPSSINKYRGVPYKWGGADKNGLDCSGFTMLVFRESRGIDLPHKASEQYKRGRSVSSRNMKLGDLVFFRDIESRGVSHVGVFIGNGLFVHASLSNGVVNSKLEDKYYKRRFVGARRISK